MKKLLTFILSLAVASTLAVGVLAAESPTNSGLVKSVKIVDNEGTEVTIGEAPAAVIATLTTAESLKEILGDNYQEGMTTISVQDVSVPAGTQFPITLTFEVSGVDANTTGYFVHYKSDGTYEVITAVFANGTMTGVFNSLSPVGIVVDKATATAIEQVYGYDPSVDPKSPQTGDAGLTLAFTAAGLSLAVVAASFAVKRSKASC